MKCCLAILFFLIGLVACQDKEMTLEELKNASWSKLDKGIEYIDLKNGKVDLSDSLRITIKGFWGTNITITPEMYNDMQPELAGYLEPIIDSFLKNSKHGYIKVNLLELATPEHPTATVFLRDNDDSIGLAQGIEMIRAIKGMTEVNYITKEQAKKKYLDGGNEDCKVLTDNPLPASIEMKFDPNIITADDYERIGNTIRSQMLYVSEISFPSTFYQKYEGNYYILEYSR